MHINIFKSDLKRTDLDRIYYFRECDKTLAYAEEKMSVDGVRDYSERMKVERKTYISDIDNIVNPERENEEKKYLLWEKLTRIRQISAWTCIVSFIIGIICSMIHSLAVIGGLLILWPTRIAFLVFIITKIGESVYGMMYRQIAQDIMEKIQAREKPFIALCQKYYKEIDDLYLYSLTPEHRETVLLRRDMAAQHKEHIQMAEQQLKVQGRIEDEQRQSRQIQQEILDNLNERKGK